MAEGKEVVRGDGVSALGVVAPVEILIECGAFSGSLGALFHLVREHKVDLLGVPLAPVCEAYLRYLLESADVDMDRAGAALAALAYLLERKAWNLLPSQEGEEPEVEDLLETTEPWVHEFAPAIEALSQLAEERSLVFFRSTDASPYELPYEPDGVSADDLAKALNRLLEKAAPDPPAAQRRPSRSLSDQMVEVMGRLGVDFLGFEELIGAPFTRSDVVWWFLALLELIRLGQARVRLEDGEVAFARAVAA